AENRAAIRHEHRCFTRRARDREPCSGSLNGQILLATRAFERDVGAVGNHFVPSRTEALLPAAGRTVKKFSCARRLRLTPFTTPSRTLPQEGADTQCGK